MFEGVLPATSQLEQAYRVNSGSASVALHEFIGSVDQSVEPVTRYPRS
ncbi:MAG: hypothetical protein ACRD3O_08315 [Terriglobia bacterium]